MSRELVGQIGAYYQHVTTIWRAERLLGGWEAPFLLFSNRIQGIVGERWL